MYTLRYFLKKRKIVYEDGLTTTKKETPATCSNRDHCHRARFDHFRRHIYRELWQIVGIIGRINIHLAQVLLDHLGHFLAFFLLYMVFKKN